ncbi:hypothetical protein L1887_50671 [Cichorium endivia]|nr:hypothetical protein L1887_50671 [Cichorium endivia]
MPQLNGRVMESRVALRQGPTMAEAAAAPLAQLTEGAEREKKGRPSNFPKISSSPSLQARAAAAEEEEKNLEPAAAAAEREWIGRATFADLDPERAALGCEENFTASSAPSPQRCCCARKSWKKVHS